MTFGFQWLFTGIVCCFIGSQRSRVAASIHAVAILESNNAVAATALDDASKQNFSNIKIDTYKKIFVGENITEKELCDNLMSADYKPTFVFDATGNHKSPSSEKVKRLLRQLGIPTISTTHATPVFIAGWEGLSSYEENYLVHVQPPADTISSICYRLSKELGLSAATVLYDSSFPIENQISELQNHRRYIKLLFNRTTGSLQDLEDLVRKWKYQQSSSRLFGLGSLNTLGQALMAGEQLHCNTEHEWYLVSKEQGNISCDCSNISALLIQPQPKNIKRLKEVEALKWNFPNMVDAAFYYDLFTLAVTAIGKEQDLGKWPTDMTFPVCDTLPVSSEDKLNITQVCLRKSMSQETFSGVYGPFIFISKQDVKQDIGFSLNKVTIQNGAVIDYKKMATFNVEQNHGLQLQQGRALNEFSTVEKYTITTVIQAPFVMKKNGINGTIQYEGLCIDFIEELAQELNFQYEIFETKDGHFGSVNDKMEWNGMIRDLIQKKADIALGPLSVTEERESVVDFTIPFYDSVGFAILMKEHEEESFLFRFLVVTEGDVWGCVGGTFIFASVLLCLLDRFSPYSVRNNPERYKDEEEKPHFTFSKSLWFVITSLTPQGGGEAPPNKSGQLAAATWWLFGFIFVATYTANLAAFLAIARMKREIESLEDLMKQHRVKVVAVTESATLRYLEKMSYAEGKLFEVWKNMSLDATMNTTERSKMAVWDYPLSDWHSKIYWTIIEQNKNLPHSFEEGLKMVQASKLNDTGFALIAEATQVKYAIMTHCRLISLSTQLGKWPIALAVQKGSSLKDKLSNSIIKLVDDRKVERLKEKWWLKNENKKTCTVIDRDGIDITNIGGVFVILLVGLTVAFVVMAIEIWYFKQRLSSQRTYEVHEKDVQKKQFTHTAE